MTTLKTEFQRRKEQMERAVYNDWAVLSANKNSARTEIMKMLMQKYGISSMSTIYAIIKRVEERNGSKTN